MCRERATNLYAGQGGGIPSGELGGVKEMIARLEIQSASYEGRWRSVLEFAKKVRGLATSENWSVFDCLTRSAA